MQTYVFCAVKHQLVQTDKNVYYKYVNIFCSIFMYVSVKIYTRLAKISHDLLKH